MGTATDVNPKQPQNALETALLGAASDPGAGGAFYAELMRADLYLVGRIESVNGEVKEGTPTAEPGDKLVVIPREGDPRIHAFTSLARLRTAIGQQQLPYIGLPTDVLFAAIDADQEIVINEGVWHGKVIVPEERALLIGGHAPGEVTELRLDAGTVVHLGAPAEYPDELVAALKADFARRGVVAEARLAQLHVPSTGIPPHPVIGIRATAGREALRSVLESLQPVVASVLREGMAVDFVDLDGGGAGEYLRAETEPFYVA